MSLSVFHTLGQEVSLHSIFFFNFYPFTSHLGSIFGHHLFCSSLLLVLLPSLFGAAILLCLGFTNAFWLVLVLRLLILGPLLCTSSTVHKTLWTFATPNLKSLGWAPMSLRSETITFCLTQLCTNLACVPSVPWISLLWTKHKVLLTFQIRELLCALVKFSPWCSIEVLLFLLKILT